MPLRLILTDSTYGVIRELEDKDRTNADGLHLKGRSTRYLYALFDRLVELDVDRVRQMIEEKYGVSFGIFKLALLASITEIFKMRTAQIIRDTEQTKREFFSQKSDEELFSILSAILDRS